MTSSSKKENKILCENRKARHDYFIEDTLEVGITLAGQEIKSIRKGSANLKGSWCSVDDNELFVHAMHIATYFAVDGQRSELIRVDPYRTRKLLAHKREIGKLAQKVSQQGYTIVPLNIHINERGLAKMTVGLCKGKKDYDKRATIKERDIERSVRRGDYQ